MQSRAGIAMESLNKQQLILLALLVSFVTSIATGIVTVSLMDQAPPGITQTINRVVEKTVERVITEPSKQTAAVVTKETVVVKADDAVIEAIDKNTGSVVRIKEARGEGINRTQSFAALGLIVSKDGLIASDLSVAYRTATDEGVSLPESYAAILPDGRIISLNIAYSDQASGVIFFQPFLQERDKGTIVFSPPAFGASALKLGQAVIALGGSESNSVSTGIISSLVLRDAPKDAVLLATSSDAKEPQKTVAAIKTDIRSSELVLGSALLNLSGEVVGLNIGAATGGSRSTFLPIEKVLEIAKKAAAKTS